MNTLKQLMAAVLMYYGTYAAKCPSFHGAYEQKVPECLAKRNIEKR